MRNNKKSLFTLLIIILIFSFSLGEAGKRVINTQRPGYVEQSIEDGYGELVNYLVTDWSKLTPQKDTSEGERDIFICMIAAQMLDIGMNWEEYLTALDNKGISYQLHERVGHNDIAGDIQVLDIFFSSKITLVLLDNPVTQAAIIVDSPYEYGCSTSLPVDLEQTRTPYTILTEDGNYVDEP